MTETPSHAPGAPPVQAESGSSLVETMLTLATVFVAALVLAGAGVTVHGQGRFNRDRSLALTQVDSLMEQMAATPIAGLPALFPHDQPIAAFAEQGIDGLDLRVVYAGGDVAARPLRYTVVASWTGGQGRTSRIVMRGSRMR
ncbi:MAG: hypothetical protein H6807_04495 [Planctomycetes bacterium]|nr:hypothetical protein [Planctomycetota bacterium]